ncbi:hypothetical protein [Burkholderia cenocepacia]|uniref:hypothetical protein n=1 Tax=Burkholderia cenocepacia TaxID=95486 RepID=UPI0007617F38|nr:hypothetical protein [Burkholderia cenocepacia]KWU17870.1 hypothetical protein AS149_14425 [Burkholderia cenocepacia]
MSEVLVADFGMIGMMLCSPLLVKGVRRHQVVHEAMFLLGARFGRVFFPVCGLTVVVSGIYYYSANPYISYHRYAASLVLHGIATVCLLTVGVLRRYDAENAALTWRSASEASVHLTVAHLSSGQARQFMQQMPVLWVRARRLGFNRLRMLSPLLADESRRRRLAALLMTQADATGHRCEVRYIESRVWNPWHSAYYYMRWARKSGSFGDEGSWVDRVFRIRVGGLVLVAKD